MPEDDVLAVKVDPWLASLSHAAAVVNIFSTIGSLRGNIVAVS
jgi:hypothetical protein